jgi:diguanylate cyclase (GGDEF)-like protein
MHRLIVRQLKKLGITELTQIPTADQWSGLLSVVSRTYKHADEDRSRLERSLDVSSREMHERTHEIKYQAFHDKLTGLPNRALFTDHMDLALAKARRSHKGTAVIFLDLDNFKLINDSLGHQAGDELLKSVADRLKGAVRMGDTVARLGGDEFTILLEDLDAPEEAEGSARRILHALNQPIEIGNGEAFASASLGIAYTVHCIESTGDLMKQADIAMYHAKATGKSSYVVYDKGMNDSAIVRLELETSLRKALELDQISVHYQPLIDLTTGLCKGAEALARWKHPLYGYVSPNQFIPIAEEIGVINGLGYFILEQACMQAKIWQDQVGNESFSISVNLSGKQLQQPDVVDRVKDILNRTQLPPHCLKLEITESVLMTDRDATVDKLNRLKQVGVMLALDDFGTGYSSLSTLSYFPLDTLKIDRAFISSLGRDSQANSIVQAIMALSKSMCMDVTGEGVETAAQLEAIQRLGCRTGQGYLFAMPLPGAEFGLRFMNPSSLLGFELTNKDVPGETLAA